MFQGDTFLAVLKENFPFVRQHSTAMGIIRVRAGFPLSPVLAAFPDRVRETTPQFLSFQADYNYSLSKLTLQVMTTLNAVH